MKEKKVFDNPNKQKHKESNMKQDFEKSKALQLEIDDEGGSPNKTGSEEEKERREK